MGSQRGQRAAVDVQATEPEAVGVQIRHKPDSVYEYRNGEPTWLSAGMLIETMAIAAKAWRREMVWEPGSF